MSGRESLADEGRNFGCGAGGLLADPVAGTLRGLMPIDTRTFLGSWMRNTPRDAGRMRGLVIDTLAPSIDIISANRLRP